MPIESELFRSLLDNFIDGVYFVDRDRTITYWNRGAERISGFAADETVGTRCFDELLMHIDAPARGCATPDARWPPPSRTASRARSRCSSTTRRATGCRCWSGPRRFATRPAPSSAPWRCSPTTRPKMTALQRANDLEKFAFVDPLTGLANRALTEITLRARLEELVRYGWPFGVLFIDIDHFKAINDRHGHAVGDQALSIVANTLRAAARSFDLVGRWGGEEFVAVLVNVSDRKLDAVAERFLTLVGSSRLPIDGTHTRVTVSIGATLADPRDTVEELVARADALMYESKQAGRNRVTTGSRE